MQFALRKKLILFYCDLFFLSKIKIQQLKKKGETEEITMYYVISSYIEHSI